MKMRQLFRKDKDGQSIIEFAMILPILLLVLFGITEFGRAIMVTNVLYTACREGARLAAVSPVGDPSVRDRVLEVLNAANIEAETIDIQVSALEKTVTVTVTTVFEVLSGGILAPLIPDPFVLRGTTVMRYEG